MASAAPAIYPRQLGRSCLAVVGLRGRRLKFLKPVLIQRVSGKYSYVGWSPSTDHILGLRIQTNNPPHWPHLCNLEPA